MTRGPGLRSQGALFGILLLSLVACGGGAGATQAPQGGGSAKPQTTAGPAATPNAAATTPPTPTTGGGQTVDACKLATAAEVSAAYGFTVASTTPSSDDNYANCEYTSADGQKARTFITISAAGAQYMRTVKINEGEPVSGVGDDAWWSTGFAPGIYFMKGGVLLYASGPSDGPDPLVVSLAKMMAGRM